MSDDQDKAPAQPSTELAAPEAKPEGWQAFHEGCYEAGKTAREAGLGAGAVAVVAGQHLADAGGAVGAAGAAAGRVLLDEGRAAGATIAQHMTGVGDAALRVGQDVGQVAV